MHLNEKYILFGIILFAFAMRFIGLNWDQGYQLHPDERAIVMFTIPLASPSSISEFLSPSSPWNPHFFAYGNAPIYLLKIIGEIAGFFESSYTTYGNIHMLGRFLSVFIDVATVYVVFRLGKKIFNPFVGLFSGFLYASSVLPIQLAHFYTVDTLLTFLTTVSLYQLLLFYENPTRIRALIIGILLGISLATKTSASVLIISIIITLSIDFLLIFLRNPHKVKMWFGHAFSTLQQLLINGTYIVSATLITFIICEPYALIDFSEFSRQNTEQYQMTRSAFTFPYTLQYVGKIPYIYEIKNIFLWGQGPIISTICILGIFYLAITAWKKIKDPKNAQEIIILTFFIAYCTVVGNFAIGFMRYMLPVYPILALGGGVFVYYCFRFFHPKLLKLAVTLFIIAVIAWPISFVSVYTHPHPRVVATEWIQSVIPHGSTLAVEHWDDTLPLRGQENYTMVTLPLYEPDTPEKWIKIENQLAQTDYIILASNRLYVPLQKLVDCPSLPSYFCYPQTAQYYQDLFKGNRGFIKVAEFTSYPSIPILNLSIRDDQADESFTVYDHPKVIIFKRQ